MWVVGDLAEGLVRTDPAYAAYRGDLESVRRRLQELKVRLERYGCAESIRKTSPPTRR